MSIGGQLRPPLITDHGRWRRAIFDSPTRVVFQRMDESFARYGASISINDNILALTKDGDRSWRANFTFKRAAKDQYPWTARWTAIRFISPTD